ncbi:MAG: hypothetical protein A2Z34_06360 [Planctomycetes bacterium RBG_16_59_8]|nr:MAG: hypothetical protein A2Z34_06360 [Planctomycetes bacterium RBG_16_59_8]
MACVGKPYHRRNWWDERYRKGEAGWDMGKVSPPLLDLVRRGRLEPCKVLVPGCGNGYDVHFLARRGFDAVGVDYALLATREAERLAKEKGIAARFIRRDFFDYARRTRDRFDLIFEQTFFCAVGREQWGSYVRSVARLIRPGGLLIGLFFDFKDTGGGPPFPTSREEVRDLFSPFFTIEHLARCRTSHPARKGNELLGRFRKRRSLR